jgi:hypothetical protein
MEGWPGLTNGWPLWRDDHPLYYHSALVTRRFLALSGTTAGYDPSFMSGYAKSVVFPASSTLPELVVALFGGRRPELAYKVYVFGAAAFIPVLIAVAGALWRIGPGGILAAVVLFLLYVWTDFPINYAAFGMLPYLLAIPLGLTATGVLIRYLETGRPGWWIATAMLMSLVVLVHFTTAMVVGLAALAVAVRGLIDGNAGRPAWSRHIAVWSIPVIVIAVNAFWWLPGIWLAATKGPSDFAFAHPEGVVRRLWQIVTIEPPIQRVLWIGSLPGFVCFARRDRLGTLGLLVFVGSGFFWGYLAGGFRDLDFLQPGRHTYALYSGLTMAAAFGLARLLAWLGERSRLRLDRWAFLALGTLGIWYFGPILNQSLRARVLGPIPFLSSRPSPRLLWVVSRLKRIVKPGERLLYEEGGFGLPGIPDPFQSGRFSGLLPEKLGIELIGGPYLHAALTTNYTQFGEGKLFGRSDWDRDWFVRHARLYRPSAILCWSPRARAFCADNPDLIEVEVDDGVVAIGRVKGFSGATIEGEADVQSSPGRLRVSNAVGGVDGSVVLRYHSVPCLRIDPPAAWEPVLLERDPVPFIKLRPPTGAVTFELRFPPGPSRSGKDR